MPGSTCPGQHYIPCDFNLKQLHSQVVGLRPLDPALPCSLLHLSCSALTPLQQCESASVVVTAALEALSTVNPGNRTDLLRVESVWAGIASSLASLSSASTQTTLPNNSVQEGIAAFFAGVRDAVVTHRRQLRLLSTLVSIISGASRLPARYNNLQLLFGQALIS